MKNSCYVLKLEAFGGFCCITCDVICLAGLEQRTVQDRSYYIGLLLSKTQELNGEIGKMTKEIETFEQDNATYLTYEKKCVPKILKTVFC